MNRQEIIIAKYKQGLSTHKIAQLLNTSSSYVYYVLKKNNINLRSISDYVGYSKYNFDRSFFEKIDNSIKAYWLGVLIADGYIDGKYKVRLHLSKKDKDWLELFKGDLKSSNLPLRYSSRRKKNDMVYMQINCRKVVDDLKKYGCVQNKTGREIFPDIPEQFFSDFIRGIFDGDGSAGFYKDKRNSWQPHFRLCGGKDLLRKTKEVLIKKSGVNNNKIREYNGIFVLGFAGFRQVKRICDFIYYEENVRCLLRKRKIFDEAFAKYGKQWSEDKEKWIKGE